MKCFATSMFILVFLAEGGCEWQEQACSFQAHFVTVNNVKLHYVDWGGKGEALLFLTELGGTADGFDPIAKRFTDRFHVLGLTRRGQGESDKPPSGYDVDTLVEDIRAFLDTLQIKRVNLAGYSIAGTRRPCLQACIRSGW